MFVIGLVKRLTTSPNPPQLLQVSFHLNPKVYRPLPWVQQLKPGKWIPSVRAGGCGLSTRSDASAAAKRRADER